MNNYFWDPSWRRRRQRKILWGYISAVILFTVVVMGGVVGGLILTNPQ